MGTAETTVRALGGLHLDWLSICHNGSEYLDPFYYERLLQPYVFGGKSDLEIFDNFLSGINRKVQAVLELGVGTGRATSRIIRRFPLSDLYGVDLSSRMLQRCRQLLAREALRAAWVCDDTLRFISRQSRKYDLIVSLWSISHAIHQSIASTGSTDFARQTMHKLFNSLVAVEGTVYLMHFDSRSQEQSVSLKQRQRAWPFLKPFEKSPSELLLDEIFGELDQDKRWIVEVNRLVGEPITFPTLEMAIETYMNFHMECRFNQTAEQDIVLKEIVQDLGVFADYAGRISIRPGCIIYKATRK